jgi:hypothetical protein
VLRWTRRTAGKADRDRGTGAIEPSPRPIEVRLFADRVPVRDRQLIAGPASGFVPEETATFEEIVWDSPVSFDHARVREPFSPHWLAQQENVIFCGPVGAGKTSSLTAPTRRDGGPSLRGRQRPELAQGQAANRRSAA